MRRSWSVLSMIAAAGAAACSAPAARAVLPAPAYTAPRTISIGTVHAGGVAVRRVTMDEYVAATIISEFAPPDGDPAIVERMLEVQAVIGRTYALAHLGRHARDGYDLCATTHCQLFQPARLKTSRWAAQVAQAVDRTSRMVLWYNGGPANALFHADCGGHTSRASDVWGGEGAAYLVAMADDGPAGPAHATWRYETPRAAALRALNADPRTRVGDRLDGIRVLERDSAGRAQQVALHGSVERIVRGETLRDALTHAFGGRTIKSTWFDVQRSGPSFVFEGRGYGHGVGLCQAGALARIRAGARLPSILQKYFPGTKLWTIG